jgi:hypothetical protein
MERSDGTSNLRRRASHEVDFETMQQPLRARVRNGRLVLDEPTDLPEGEEVELVPADADHMDDEERAALRAELRASIAEAREGRLIDAADVIAELRTIR